MERFLEKGGARSAPAQRQIEAGDAALSSAVPGTPQMEVSGPCTAPPTTASDMDDTTRIARAVADLLAPTIADTVERAVHAGMQQLRKELGEQNARLSEAEAKISNLEEELYQSQATEQAQDKTNQYILQKLDDLENRSRRSNLRFVGVPESMQPPKLLDFCARRIPEALGIPGPLTVERAHRMGMFSSERKSPRAIIAKYLNYADKAAVLFKYRQARSLQIDGVKILIFADYSAEVSKKRKAFQHICAALINHQVKFTLAFPATLRLKAPNGDQLVFHDPSEAEIFIRSLSRDTQANAPTKSSTSVVRALDQRSPRKDSPKRLKPSSARDRSNQR